MVGLSLLHNNNTPLQTTHKPTLRLPKRLALGENLKASKRYLIVQEVLHICTRKFMEWAECIKPSKLLLQGGFPNISVSKSSYHITNTSLETPCNHIKRAESSTAVGDDKVYLRPLHTILVILQYTAGVWVSLN